MRQSSIAQSPARTAQLASHSASAKYALHPVLQNALTHVDVRLEDELIRYRRQRALGKAFYQPCPPVHKKVSTVLELMPTDAPDIPLPSSSAAGFHPTVIVPPLAEIPVNKENLESSSSSSELRQLAQQYATQVADESDLAAAMNSSPDDYLESSEELLRALSQEEASVQAEQGFMQSLLTPLGVGSMLLLLLSSAMFGFVIMNPSSVSRLFNRSEAVTSSGSTPSDSARLPQPNLANQEFPELSLGSLGTIQLEDGAIAPNVVHPSPAKSSLKAKTATTPANLGASGRVTGSSNSAPPAVPVAPPQVNETAPEPVLPSGDVPSPRKLAPSVNPAPVAPSVPYNPAPARAYNPVPTRSYSPPPPVRTYSAPPVQNPSPPAVKPVQPAPTRSAAPAPLGDRTPLPPASPTVTASPLSKPSSYKVVTPYTSDAALQEARRKVPDAYVKNYSDGAKVQFGSYQDEAAAKSQAESLRQQGIPAEVYQP